MTNWLPPLPPEPFEDVARQERALQLHARGRICNDVATGMSLVGVAGIIIGHSVWATFSVLTAAAALRLVALKLWHHAGETLDD